MERETWAKIRKQKREAGRWWEYYFVRYALGTVIGAIIVRLLAMQGMSFLFPGVFPIHFPD
jgi:hypothetical protein